MPGKPIFRRVIQRFIKVFCGPEHPLVIFLDDLQWIDSASMRLLELMTEHNSGLTHLMFIGAYRDNEMPPSHSVTVWLNEIRRRNIIPLEEIRLVPLGKEDIIHLTADALGATTQQVVPLANYAGRGNTFRRRQLRRVSRNLKRLKIFARMNPANCLNKQRLVEAERMRALGREFNAHPLYDESIRLARNHGFLHEEALANELCGNMHADGDRMTLALPYLAKARQIYNFWGAHAKAKDLEQRFPQLIAREHQRNSTTSWKTSQTSINFSILFKALKAIAEETVHSRMVEVIISTALQFAGAQQGMLLLRDAKGNLCIEAETGVDGNDPEVLQSIPVDQAELSQSVINYVNRSRSGIVIHDAQKVNSEIPGINQDSHIKTHGIKSLLCLPIISNHVGQDDLIGMLYLEKWGQRYIYPRAV